MQSIYQYPKHTSDAWGTGTYYLRAVMFLPIRKLKGRCGPYDVLYIKRFSKEHLQRFSYPMYLQITCNVIANGKRVSLAKQKCFSWASLASLEDSEVKQILNCRKWSILISLNEVKEKKKKSTNKCNNPITEPAVAILLIINYFKLINLKNFY